jgi:cobaltochelatase CobN
VITSLKEKAAAEFVRGALARLSPAVIVTTTAFAAAGEPGEPTALDGPDVPVLQVVIATTKRAAWRDSARGLGAADLAMHVVLPELDGRVLAGAVAFGSAAAANRARLHWLVNCLEADRIAMAADRIAARTSRDAATQRAARRDPDAGPSRRARPRGYAVGLDVPASVLACSRPRCGGYAAGKPPPTPRALLQALDAGQADTTLPLDTYVQWLADLLADGRHSSSAGATFHSDLRDVRSDPSARVRQCLGRAAARPRPLEQSTPDYHDPAPPRRTRRLRPVVAAKATRSCTWARTARSNGRRARR